MIMLLASTKDGGIGTDKGLPWKCPLDLQDFQRTTMGQIVVVGRKTYESIPNGLPGRIKVMLTHTPTDPLTPQSDVIRVTSVDSVLKAIESIRTVANDLHLPQGKVYVIGGRETYMALRDHITEIRHTCIPDEYVTEPATVHLHIRDFIPDAERWSLRSIQKLGNVHESGEVTIEKHIYRRQNP